MIKTYPSKMTKSEAISLGLIETSTAATITKIDPRSACKYMKNIGLRFYNVTNSLTCMWEPEQVKKLADDLKSINGNQLSLLPAEQKPALAPTKEISTKALPKTQVSGLPDLITLAEFRKISMTPSIAVWKLKGLGFEPAALMGSVALFNRADAIKYRDTHSRNGRKAQARLVSQNTKVKAAMVSQGLPSIEALKAQYPTIADDLTKLFETVLHRHSLIKKS